MGLRIAHTVLAALVALTLAGCTAAPAGRAPVTTRSTTPVTSATAAPTTATPRVVHDDPAFAALEQQHGARVGVAAIDTGSGRTVSYRAGERFASASTGKVFIAAATLQRDDDLDAVVPYRAADVLANSPVTSGHAGEGMTVRALVDAMLRYSDNTAANVLVARLGGPDAVQRYLRGIGDDTTRVDRTEPDLNTATPGDDRDTTTPAAAARDLRALLLGNVLDASDRALLGDTMLANTTGATTIRAGVEPGWRVADKTGTGGHGVRNDVAVLYPEHGAPIVLVVMTAHAAPDAAPDDALVAAAARTALAALAR